MRDIRFRAWNGVEMVGACCVVDGSYFQLQDGRTAGNFMQFTGLHDKNGKEIYEGDILSHKFYSKPVQVYFKDACFHAEDVSLFSGSLEVIGNIHANPELLK